MTGLLHDLPMGGTSTTAFDHVHLAAATHAPQPSATAHHEMTLAAHTTTSHSGELPANMDDAPDLGTLGHYNAHTGAGTIWHQVVTYADKMGYGHLSEKQKHDLVGKTLDHMGLSWSDARHKHSNYHPDMPTQHTMQTWLHTVHAEHTHATSRAPSANDGMAGMPGMGNHDSSTTPAPGAALSPPHGTPAPAEGTPWYKRVVIPDLNQVGIDWVNVGVAAATVGLLGSGAVVGGRAIDRRTFYRRANQRRYDDAIDEPTQEHAIVTPRAASIPEAAVDEPPQRIPTENTVPRRADWQYAGPVQSSAVAWPIAGRRPEHAVPQVAASATDQQIESPAGNKDDDDDDNVDIDDHAKTPIDNRSGRRGLLRRVRWPWTARQPSPGSHVASKERIPTRQ